MTSRNANLYVTLSEFKSQLGISSTDTIDDSYLSQTLEEASRSIDDMCGRFFYPAVDTLYYDTPIDDRLRFWYDDLLEPLTVTNGSNGALSSSDYYMIPYNKTPYVALALKSGTGQVWVSDTDNITEKAIALEGIWGYRQNYSRDGWHTLTTLGAGEDSDTSALTVTDDTSAKMGDILRIDNEIITVTAEPTGAGILTVERAWNGSTGAAHLNNAPVKRWYVEPAVVKATAIQAHRLFKRRDAPFGVVANAASGGDMRISNLDMDVIALVRPYARMF